MILNIMLYCCLLAVLIYASYKDIVTREVSNWVHLIIIALGVVRLVCLDFNWVDQLLGLVIGGLPFFLVGVFCPGKVGGADFKLMAVCGLLVGLNIWIGVVIGLLLCIFFNFFTKKAIPLIPYLSVGVSLISLFNIIGGKII